MSCRWPSDSSVWNNMEILSYRWVSNCIDMTYGRIITSSICHNYKCYHKRIYYFIRATSVAVLSRVDDFHVLTHPYATTTAMVSYGRLPIFSVWHKFQFHTNDLQTHLYDLQQLLALIDVYFNSYVWHNNNKLMSYRCLSNLSVWHRNSDGISYEWVTKSSIWHSYLAHLVTHP